MKWLAQMKLVLLRRDTLVVFPNNEMHFSGFVSNEQRHFSVNSPVCFYAAVLVVCIAHMTSLCW